MVRNFNKTYQKHLKRMSNLEELMKEQDLDYDSFLDSESWVTIETQTYKVFSRWNDMGIKTTQKQLARLINDETRKVIVNSLEYYDLPKSYDTAFFIMNYQKTIEGMVEILQNFIDRGEFIE
jgi:hypothetical protein